MELILHAGTGKTGTTAIQRYLRLRREALARDDVLFPETPGPQRHVRFALFVTPDDEFIGSETARRQGGDPTWGPLIQDSPSRFRDSFRRALLDEIESSGLTRVLISDESLFRSTEPGLRLIKDFTGPHTRSVRLVVYLRRQDDHLISRYQQAVKWGEVRRLAERTAQLTLARSYDYAGQLDRWTRIVQPTEVVVRRFARREFRNGSLIQDFLAAVGIEVPLELAEDPPAVNTSLDAESVEFLRILNLVLVDRPAAAGRIEQRKLLRRLSRASSGPHLTLPEPVLDRFMAQWDAGNRVVAERYFGEHELFPWPRKANTTTRQFLDPSRTDHFLEVTRLPPRLHEPLRRMAEREASCA